MRVPMASMVMPPGAVGGLVASSSSSSSTRLRHRARSVPPALVGRGHPLGGVLGASPACDEASPWGCSAAESTFGADSTLFVDQTSAPMMLGCGGASAASNNSTNIGVGSCCSASSTVAMMRAGMPGATGLGVGGSPGGGGGSSIGVGLGLKVVGRRCNMFDRPGRSDIRRVAVWDVGLHDRSYSRQAEFSRAQRLLACGLSEDEVMELLFRDITPEDYETLLKLDELVPKKIASQEMVDDRLISLPPESRRHTSCGVCLMPFEDASSNDDEPPDEIVAVPSQPNTSFIELALPAGSHNANTLVQLITSSFGLNLMRAEARMPHAACMLSIT
eukprot:CAMPEP_0206421832 /NCGR_PEP_ID=MMETSP0324_2-20121206/1687_1 /ASSEMBLY_ACC=CAM_ASM_000836 /TAXON_ID=2866 /ORGANISM="Crypthecodinium cohnii, Strain Seligo" /LENGTH=331 /DNA_ID=CAMNT_0053886011 /DNA_START=74 /DNA_END=1066 /DNA_ORIENTATION=-